MTQPPHPALKLVRPSFLVGALLVLAGVVVLRGIVELEPRNLIAILFIVPGIGLLFFAATVTMAGRVLTAAINTPEHERPTWDDEDTEEAERTEGRSP